MNLEPIYAQVVIEPMEKPQDSAVLRADTAKERPTQGKVIAVGEDAKKVQPGDLVVFMPHAGYEVDKYLVMDQTQILCKVKNA